MQVTLRMTKRASVGHHPAAMICQLIKRAGIMAGLGDEFPPRVIPDPVEVGRMELAAGSDYALGLTLWDPQPSDCLGRWNRLAHALHEIGQQQTRTGQRGLGGNFTIERVHSLVDPNCQIPLAIPADWIDAQVDYARRRPRLTLRWLSPLCAQLPRRFGKRFDQVGDSRAGFFDPQRFPLADLCRRLLERLTNSFQCDFSHLTGDDSEIHLLDPPGLTSLAWIKWMYGRQEETKSLFGVMGRIVVQVDRPELVLPLVLGQYTAVGEKTNFGLGRYVIEETQAALPPGTPRFLRATRARTLVQLAMEHPSIEQEAERLNESVGHVRRLAKQIVANDFEPQPVERFLLPGEKPRLLAIPSRAERALQRAVHELLSPVLDRYLTDSCIAYRKGLGRHTAADRIHRAFREGWRWALRADFHRFFDSIDHRLLREQLEVYIQDDAMVDLLMQWVAAGAPQPGCGLPTGAVVSPLLANLFLEQFDEQVREDGGLLVRYADDFVLLFRDPGHGRQILERARELAERLKLHLNDDKTKLVDLDKTPFDFLGYRFFSEKGWQYRGDGLVQIEDLGWHEAPRGREAPAHRRMPGEQGLETSRSGIWIVGPHIDWVGIEGKDVVCRGSVDGTENRFQRRRISELIVLGNPTLDRSLFSHAPEVSLGLIIADDAGRWVTTLTDEPPWELPQLIRAQVALHDDPQRRLALSQRLISAKLHNYASLASAYPARQSSGMLAEKLRNLSEQAMKTADEQQLLGVEGAGAAAWYAEFAQRIDHRFAFETRQHPFASDPVNALLNLTQTVLHRVICLTLMREGFAPSLGIFHRGGDGHAALASDLQEPFRYLMDRVVIEVTSLISPGEFHPAPAQSRFPLRMEAGTYRTVVAAVYKMLAIECTGLTQEAPRSYRRQVATACRSLHRHLLNGEAQFKIFQAY